MHRRRWTPGDATTFAGDTSAAVTQSQVQTAVTNWYGLAAKALMAGAIGGAASKLQGGSFLTGFEFSAGFQFAKEMYRALVPFEPQLLGHGEARYDKEVDIGGFK